MGGGGGGLEQFSVSPRPLGFVFGTLGLRVWGQGLTIKSTKTRFFRNDEKTDGQTTDRQKHKLLLFLISFNGFQLSI